jgi:hypothetical protein
VAGIAAGRGSPEEGTHVSAVDEILQQIPLSQLAAKLGTDEQTAGAAAQQAIPALLGGLHANAQDPAGAASLEGALGQHSSALVDGGVDLDQVDPAEGQKIVGNIFGGHTDGVAQTLGGNLGGSGQGDLVQRLLPLLAPVVLSYLAKQMGGGAGGAGGVGGGLLGSVLGGLAGGGPAGGGGGVADVLGGLIGGGQQGQAGPGGGGVTDLLGGLLGGGRR